MTAFACPCCGFLTMPEQTPGSLETCHVCLWQDDLLGCRDPSTAVGPNAVSLHRARENFRDCGACEARFTDSVRAPLPEEHPPPRQRGIGDRCD